MKHVKKTKTEIPTGRPNDDLERYVAKRKSWSAHLAERFEQGYQVFRIGALWQAEREKAGRMI